MNKLNIGVVFGGKSSEYDVSLHSAANVINALDEDKYDITKIGITQDGRWYVTRASSEEIASDKWVYSDSNQQCSIPHDPTVGGILIFDEVDYATVFRIDCFILVIHGDHGEDGEIQGLFGLSEIPYVGSGVKSSANCMDKSCTKELAKLTGVKMAKHYLARFSSYINDKEKLVAEIRKAHEDKYPLFVKPCSAGSSVGVTKVKSEKELGLALDEAFKYDKKVLVEEAIVGRELEIAVLGNEYPKASSIGEILTAGEFYTYEAKYSNPESKTRVVTDLPQEVVEKFQSVAIDLYKELDCRGLARVDFFYTKEGEIVFNEINTLPGFTDISMYPQLWKNDGIETNELMDRLIALAFEEHAEWKR